MPVQIPTRISASCLYQFYEAVIGMKEEDDIPPADGGWLLSAQRQVAVLPQILDSRIKIRYLVAKMIGSRSIFLEDVDDW